MKCPACRRATKESIDSCPYCGTSLNPSITSAVAMVIKYCLIGSLTGSGTGVSFKLVHDILTTDLKFDLWEFGVALLVSCLVGVGISFAAALATHSKTVSRGLWAVSCLTLLIPVVPASFGASGSEPLWQYPAIGLIGGLFWSIPFALWQLTKKRNA